MAEGRKSRPVRLALMWSLQAQFAGYLLARSHGLPELELLERRPGRSPVQEVLEGGAELAVASPAHVMTAGPRSRELVLVGLFMARSPVRLAGLRNRVGADLWPASGLRVGVWSGEDLELRAMLRSAGTELAEVELVPVADEVAALLEGRVDYVQCTTYNELPAIQAAAGGLGTVVAHDPADWSVDVPKDGIVVSAELLRSQPDVVERFLRAAVAGWRAALADRPAAAAAVCGAAPGLDRDEQRLQLDRVAALFDPAHRLGEPRADDVRRAVHAARVAGGDVRDVPLDRGPWERAHG